MYTSIEEEIAEILNQNETLKMELQTEFNPDSDYFYLTRYRLACNYRQLFNLYLTNKAYHLAAYYHFLSYKIDDQHLVAHLDCNLDLHVEYDSLPPEIMVTADLLIALQYFYGIGKIINLEFAYEKFKQIENQ